VCPNFSRGFMMGVTTWVVVTLLLRTPAGDNINPMQISFSKRAAIKAALSF